jgi:SAM-dependent methyltransferase
VTEPSDPWADRRYLRDVQYRTDGNLAARQSIYAYQHPRIDLAARVLDLALSGSALSGSSEAGFAGPRSAAMVADVGCGNGIYLAELAGRGYAGRMVGVDLSIGMLAAARQRVGSVAGPAAARPSLGLANADATALPFPDGAADLTLAMHMLYHVPDRPAAVRELHRVTKPGGRVVIGLNGKDHLRELREVIGAVRGADSATLHERVDLDAGQSLAEPFFAKVTRHDLPAELRVPDAEPLSDYIRSMTLTHDSADPDRLVAAVLSTLPRAPDGSYPITTHAGCLICEA